jgi:hypothetical protein
MNEWYVYLEAGVPKEIILGRRQALERLIKDARVTRDEYQRWQKQLTLTPELGRPIRIVGWGLDEEDPEPDRWIVRVLGPGSEV